MAKKTAELTFLTAKSPYWQMDFVVEGERVCRSTRTADKKQAERIARAEWQAARDRAAERRKATGRKDMTLSATIDDYLSLKGSYPSRGRDVQHFAWLARWIGEDTYVSQITHETLVELVKRKRGERRQGYANARQPNDGTIRTVVVATLRKLLNHAKESCGVSLPYEPRYRRLKLKKKARVAELMVEQQVRIMRCARQDVMDPAEFILETGFRRETAMLTWDQVSFAQNVIRVVTKGDEPQEITMTRRAREILLRAEGHHPVHVFTFVAQRNGRTRNGKVYEKGKRYPMSGYYLLMAWKQACQRADVGALRVHDLRKTHGARIVRETGDLLAASKSLRHANITMTATHYAHISRKDVDLRVAQAAEQTRAQIELLLSADKAPDQAGAHPEG